MPIIHWYNHHHEMRSTKFVSEAMLRFEREVTRQTGLTTITQELPHESAQVVLELLQNPEYVNEGLLISALFDQLRSVLPKVERLVLYCPNANTVRHMAKREMGIEHLPWGVASAKSAFVFEPEIRQVIWHEALHTIGAEDCYDNDRPKERFPRCTDTKRKCLMQFVPTFENCGDGFPICSRVLGEIRSGLGQ